MYRYMYIVTIDNTTSLIVGIHVFMFKAHTADSLHELMKQGEDDSKGIQAKFQKILAAKEVIYICKFV